ncbi:hypothetical protein [Bosea sp. FBZP-16]|uniref:hypothetical protein n=1 Tax=Bosea sp. FBZP-16 TaxID=2065382 RepID=UPI001319E9CE|nr:hypothetical protein [Bosea sp. FBZP-16]
MTAPRIVNPTQRSFNSAIRAAQVWLMADAPARALEALRIALGHANRLSPAARKMVLRVMCWIRQKERMA